MFIFLIISHAQHVSRPHHSRATWDPPSTRQTVSDWEPPLADARQAFQLVWSSYHHQSYIRTRCPSERQFSSASEGHRGRRRRSRGVQTQGAGGESCGTPGRCRCVARWRTTSSVRSECSESQTKPIVTISGQFIKTRRIFIFWPQLL